MAADANIFAQFLRPPTSAMEYADKYAASEAAQQQNALARLTMQEKADALAEQNRLKQLYMQNPNISADELKRSGFRNEALKMDAAALEKRKTETEIGYKVAQTSKEQIEAQAKAADAAHMKLERHRQEAYGVKTPQDAVAWIDSAINDGVPGFTRETRDQAIAKIDEYKGDMNAWKAAVNEASTPTIKRFEQAAEDARAALKAATPDYTVLDSSTGVVRVDKKTGLAQPVTYAPTSAPAPAYVPPQASAPSQPAPQAARPAAAPGGAGSSDRYIAPETQRARDDDRLVILTQELQRTTDPALRAALQREIGRVGGAAASSPASPAPVAPSQPIQVQPKQKDPGQPFAGEDAAGPGFFQMVNGQPVRVPGLKPKADASAGKISAEVQRQIGGVMDFDKSLAALEEALKDFNPRGMDQLNVAKRAKIESLAKQAQLSAKEAAALGALTGPDMALLEGILVDPASAKGAMLGAKGIQAQIAEARSGNQRRVKTLSEQYGEKATAGMNPNLRGVTPVDNSKLFNDADAILRGGR